MTDRKEPMDDHEAQSLGRKRLIEWLLKRSRQRVLLGRMLRVEVAEKLKERTQKGRRGGKDD